MKKFKHYALKKKKKKKKRKPQPLTFYLPGCLISPGNIIQAVVFNGHIAMFFY